MDPTLQGVITAYRALEHQPEYVSALDAALASKNTTLLTERFAKRIAFGTAGLRGLMGFGLACMNSVTVQQASQGLCAYYVNQLGLEECQKRCVVVGFDGRHNSRYFAHITAAVFMSRGIRVLMAGSVTATPMTPFMVAKYNALCGVQVTASHNPKDDNGYKVYASNGAQIIPPMDAEVHQLILSNQCEWPGVKELLRHELKSLNTSLSAMRLVHDPMYEAWPAYKAAVISDLSLRSLRSSNIKVVYTAMHGVGFPFVSDLVLRGLEFPASNFVVVHEQRDPDPEFSTVSFPNPEEAGALDLAIATAEANNASIVIANDPDADRFAAAERRPDGAWIVFTGDELGSMFGAMMLEQAQAAGVPLEKMAFVCSAVSSRFLARMCAVEGTHFDETMTGFKWMMNKAIELRDRGFVPCFSYEEALGYGLCMHVPDKDGVSAAAQWITKATKLHADGRTMYDYLQELYQRYGFFATDNSYYVCREPALMAAVFEQFRKDGYPTQIAGYDISRVRDLSKDYDSATDDHHCAFPKSSADMLTIFFANGAHITLRGSGTEPKFKYYSEMSHPTSKEAAADQLRTLVQKVLKELIGDRPMIHANDYKTQSP